MAYTGGKLTIEEALAAVHCYALMYGTGTEIPKEEFAQWTWDTNIYYEGEKHTTFYPENKEKEFTLASNYFVEYLPMDNYNGDGYADRTGTAIQEVFKFNSAAEEHDPNKILENIIAAMDDPGKYKKQIQSIRDDLVSFEEFQKRTELFKERQDILKASVMLDQLELYMLTIGGEKDTRDIRIRHEDNNPSQKAFNILRQHNGLFGRQRLCRNNKPGKRDAGKLYRSCHKRKLRRASPAPELRNRKVPK